MDSRKEKEYQSLKIKLYGIVQGVGFRPFVVKLAFSLGVTGTVKNSGGMVDITVSGSKPELDAFVCRLFSEKPAESLIVHHEIFEIPFISFESFTIEQSDDSQGPVFISPDLCVCEDCLKELESEGDARYLHPFISCMVCGPRYSIIENAPYDRETTTMRDFGMCSFCESQYTDRTDRRYHAQTISCHDCGPYLIYRDNTGKETQYEQAFQNAVHAVKTGGVIAVKGVGGYHLCCSPYDQTAVLRLRNIKGREFKPFAVMFPDLDVIRDHAHLSEEEEALLLSVARPIVLLKRKTNNFAPRVCGDSRYVGAFLGYTPLHALLLKACGPLVMTSANMSEEPVIKDDAAMLAWPSLNGVLYNTRRIAARMDDSVVKVTEAGNQMVRRSRGYAPLPMIQRSEYDGAVFATGGQLKATFCLTSGPFAYLSPHIGDLSDEGCEQAFRESLDHMQKLLRIEPQLAVCDRHPGYTTSVFAQSLKLPVLKVQHHHAHIASVLAEHSITEPVIGIAFDGTGWGDGGSVWGSEFFVCRDNCFERAGHIKPVRFLGGDEGMKDAAKSAMFYLHDAKLDAHISDSRWPLIKAAIESGINTHANSGMGRLFDAASAILGICEYNRYEGECAIKLEKLASEAIEAGIDPAPMAFEITQNNGILSADAAPVIKTLSEAAERDKRAMALGFHQAVAEMALKISQQLRDKTGMTTVALSGGVLQNAVLLTDLKRKLEADGFSVYINHSVPPNDGGISLGQAFIGMTHLSGREYKTCV